MPTKNLIAVIISMGIIGAVSCNETGSGKAGTKEDSLRIASIVKSKYPSELRDFETKDPGAEAAKSSAVAEFESSNLEWDTLMKYWNNYDKSPFSCVGESDTIKGFMVTPDTYKSMQENVKIEGFFLRFGKKDDGTYTIMIMGTDADGKLLEVSNELPDGELKANFDNIKPCPYTCPSNMP